MGARSLSRKLTALLGATVMLGSLAAAQTSFTMNGGATIHGVPPSVTSFGFGGSPGFNGVPPSVTSLNFGNAPVFRGNGFGFHSRPFGFGRHGHRRFVSPFFGNVVAVPYYVSPYYVMEPGVDDTMEQEDYRGGPTIFDRRGPGTREYEPREPRREAEEDYRVSTPPEEPRQQEVAEQPETVLVFKDGHQLEISNYAIVGSTLYDLSQGRTHKVALAELDLAATVKQNDSRGVDFRLPVAVKAN